MSAEIRGLSLWQPWASLVAIGEKQYETRSWPTRYRGWIAIHAAMKWEYALELTCRARAFRDSLRQGYREPIGKETWRDILPFGQILAVAYLAECVPTGTGIHDLWEERNLTAKEFAFGDFSAGRYAWRLDRVVQLLTPIPLPGQRGLFPIPDEVASKLDAYIRRGESL